MSSNRKIVFIVIFTAKIDLFLSKYVLSTFLCSCIMKEKQQGEKRLYELQKNNKISILSNQK